jgi:hypothetical protein
MCHLAPTCCIFTGAKKNIEEERREEKRREEKRRGRGEKRREEKRREEGEKRREEKRGRLINHTFYALRSKCYGLK